MNKIVSWTEEIEARSCDAVHVSDSTLGGVPARVFQPVGGGRLKRGIVYFHGGGWALGSGREWHLSYGSNEGHSEPTRLVLAGMRSYDLMCRKMAKELDSVVMSVE